MAVIRSNLKSVLAPFALFFLAIIFNDKPIYSENITIATWNIQNFASWNRNEEMLTFIARIINNYDIVAIQEVKDYRVIYKTVRLLREIYGKDYGFEMSPPVGYHYKSVKRRNTFSGGHEYYAFLYNRKLIKPLSKGTLYPDKYRCFLRKPFFMEFKAKNFDFILVTVHLLYKTKSARKVREINGLAYMHSYLTKIFEHEKDLIFLGDFNLKHREFDLWEPLNSTSSMEHIFNYPEKSMVSGNNLYDNILFDPLNLQEWTGEKGIYYFDKVLFGDNIREAKKWCSDHRPLWSKFRTDLEDDD